MGGSNRLGQNRAIHTQNQGGNLRKVQFKRSMLGSGVAGCASPYPTPTARVRDLRQPGLDYIAGVKSDRDAIIVDYQKGVISSDDALRKMNSLKADVIRGDCSDESPIIRKRAFSVIRSGSARLKRM